MVPVMMGLLRYLSAGICSKSFLFLKSLRSIPETRDRGREESSQWNAWKQVARRREPAEEAASLRA